MMALSSRPTGRHSDGYDGSQSATASVVLVVVVGGAVVVVVDGVVEVLVEDVVDVEDVVLVVDVDVEVVLVLVVDVDDVVLVVVVDSGTSCAPAVVGPVTSNTTPVRHTSRPPNIRRPPADPIFEFDRPDPFPICEPPRSGSDHRPHSV